MHRVTTKQVCRGSESQAIPYIVQPLGNIFVMNTGVNSCALKALNYLSVSVIRRVTSGKCTDLSEAYSKSTHFPKRSTEIKVNNPSVIPF